MNEKIESREFDISLYVSKYFIPLKERKWIVIFIFLLGLLVAMVTTLFVKPEFISQGTLLVEEPLYEISKIKEESVGMRAARWQYVTAEEEKLKSTSFASEVLNVLPDKVKEDLKTPIALGSQIIEGVRKWLKEKLGEQRVENLLRKESGPPAGITERGKLTASHQIISSIVLVRLTISECATDFGSTRPTQSAKPKQST